MQRTDNFIIKQPELESTDKKYSETTDLIKAIQAYNKILIDVNKGYQILHDINLLTDEEAQGFATGYGSDFSYLSYSISFYGIQDNYDFYDAKQCKKFFIEITNLQLKKHELEKKQAYAEIVRLLKAGANPNTPEIVCRYKQTGTLGNLEFDVFIRKTYPLHSAIDKDVIDLLLNYGADPSLRGYAPAKDIFCQGEIYQGAYKVYKNKKDNLTPLESALIPLHEFYRSLASEGSAWTEDLGYHVVSGFKNNNRMLCIEHLSSQCSVNDLLKLFEIELTHEKSVLEFLNKHMENPRFKQENDKQKNIIRFGEIIQQKMDISRKFLVEKLSLPIYLALYAGHRQENNVFASLPYELLKYIMVILSHTNICELAISKMQLQRSEREKQAAVFKNLLFIMAEYLPSLKNEPVLASKSAEIFSKEIILPIDNIKAKENRSKKDQLIIALWQLASEQADNFHSTNQHLIDRLAELAEKHDKTYHALTGSVYKVKMFEPVQQKHLAWLKKDILKQVDMCNQSNKNDGHSPKRLGGNR